jgi:REP element-mobilizing transposase RayT
MPFLIAHHIYFTTYGTWLHGDERGSWDKHESDKLPSDPLLKQRRMRQLKHRPVTLAPAMRDCVDAAIRAVCEFRQWQLRALNVRASHVHVAVGAGADPIKMLHDLKAYATRRLREQQLVPPAVRIWTAKGGIKGVYHPDGLRDLIKYIRYGQ